MILKQIRSVFMGSPEIAVPALKALSELTTTVGVVTQPDRPAGRGKKLAQSAVKSFAVGAGIPVMQPVRLRTEEAFAELSAWQPQLIVVMAYGQILRTPVLNLPQYGCPNLHASLLPRWRGASPVQAAILAGDDISGVSLMKMDAGMDTGPVYTMQPINLEADETSASLSQKMAALAAELLKQSLQKIIDGRIQPVPQPEEGVTYTSLIKKEDGILDITQSAAALERQVRAYNPWPTVQLNLPETSLKILISSTADDAARLAPGSLTRVGGDPAIAVQDGLLVLKEVQPAGKKPMSGKAFLSGYRNWEGIVT